MKLCFKLISLGFVNFVMQDVTTLRAEVKCETTGRMNYFVLMTIYKIKTFDIDNLY